jgi:fatty acid desaturase
MPVVAAIRPTEIFARDEWAALTALSHWRGLWLVAHAWLSIILIIAVTLWIDHAIAWVPALFLLGGRQLGLAILMHEAAHGLIHPDRRINNIAGQWLTGAAVSSDLLSYRAYHLTHHRYTQQPEDPDLALSQPFPTSKASLWRKVVRDLTGQTFVKQRMALFGAALRGGPTRATVARFLAVQALLLAVSLLLYGWTPFLLWLAALATTFQLALRIRNIAEHACTATGPGDPFSHARTTGASLIERMLVAPYWVNFHIEHHLFMGVPCYRLKRVHHMLLDRGHGPRMTLADGYANVLRQVVRAV